MKNNNQLTSNVGLYYVCYELSKRGWNVMITARNARGVDIVMYSQDANKMKTIQVKSSTESILPTVRIEYPIADYLIIITKVYRRDRDIYICNKDKIKDEIEKGLIQRSSYKHFKNNWKSIGNG